MKLLYEDYSNSQYLVLDFCVTHSQLLIRKRKNNVNPANIDIIFKAVNYMYIPTRFKDISINLIEDDAQILAIKNKFEFTTSNGNMIFRLSDSVNSEFYINALAFGIFENTFELRETYLEGDLETEQNKLLFWFKGLIR